MLKVRFTKLLVIILTFLVILISLNSCWGTHGFVLIIDNKTDQTLTLYLHEEKIGEIQPGKQLEQHTVERGKYLITAKDDQGVVVFNKEYTFHELSEADWKIVIEFNK